MVTKMVLSVTALAHLLNSAAPSRSSGALHGDENGAQRDRACTVSSSGSYRRTWLTIEYVLWASTDI